MKISIRPSHSTGYSWPEKVVEVFKTNVRSEWQSRQIIEKLQQILPGTRINFDLEDCDNILRIESASGPVDTHRVLRILESSGCYAEILL